MSVQAPNRLHQLALGLQSREVQGYHVVDQAFVNRMQALAPTADDYATICAHETDLNRGTWWVSTDWVSPEQIDRMGIAQDLRAMRMAIGAHLGIEKPGFAAWFRGVLSALTDG